MIGRTKDERKSRVNQINEKRAIAREAEKAKKLVLEKEPNAFFDEAFHGEACESDKIGVKQLVTSQCRECHQPWSRKEVVQGRYLGSGYGEAEAWINAARNLGLMK